MHLSFCFTLMIIFMWFIYCTASRTRRQSISGHPAEKLKRRYEAQEICRNQGMDLPALSDHRSAKLALKKLQELGISQTWTALERTQDAKWRWLDSTAQPRAPAGASDIKRCSILRIRAGRDIYARGCDKTVSGIICLSQDCKDCSNCYPVPAHAACLKLMHQKTTWYRSVRVCQDQGDQLLGNNINIETLNISAAEQKDYWIGLVKGGWVINSAYKARGFLKWGRALKDLGESSGKNCALMTKTADSWKLQPASCTSNSTFMCVSEKRDRPWHMNPLFLGLTVGGIVALEAVFFVVIFVCVCRWKKKRASRTNAGSGQYLEPVGGAVDHGRRFDSEVPHSATLPSSFIDSPSCNLGAHSASQPNILSRYDLTLETDDNSAHAQSSGTWAGVGSARYHADDSQLTLPTRMPGASAPYTSPTNPILLPVPKNIRNTDSPPAGVHERPVAAKRFARANEDGVYENVMMPSTYGGESRILKPVAPPRQPRPPRRPSREKGTHHRTSVRQSFVDKVHVVWNFIQGY